jgi:hypothetical protein
LINHFQRYHGKIPTSLICDSITINNTDSCTGFGKAWLSHGFVMFKVHLYYIQPEIISDLVNCWYSYRCILLFFCFSLIYIKVTPRIITTTSFVMCCLKCIDLPTCDNQALPNPVHESVLFIVILSHMFSYFTVILPSACQHQGANVVSSVSKFVTTRGPYIVFTFQSLHLIRYVLQYTGGTTGNHGYWLL